MATDITLTAALRSNLLSLQNTQRNLDTIQLRLATGKKVNSALDNANAFFAAQALSNRASDLSGLLDGIGQSIQVLKAADTGISSLTKLVEQAKSIAQSGRDTVSTSGLARSGDFSAAAVANLTSAGGFTNGQTITLTNGATGATGLVTISTGQTLQSLADSINAITGFSAKIVDSGVSTGIFVGGKRLEIRATGGTLTLAGSAPAVINTQFQLGIGAGATAGTTGGGVAVANNTAIAATSNTPDQITLQTQYNAIRTQINQLIIDTGYRGTNLLNGDTLRTQFNEGNTSSQSVTGVTFNATGLGISTANFLASANIDTALSQLNTSLSTLRTQAQTFGNNLTVIQARQDFTSNLINTLKEGSDKLTLADKNEEGANLLSLQTAQQLGVTALSLASQASQSVLRLFS
jgi:flagellin-like hook-associated protein FlgL